MAVWHGEGHGDELFTKYAKADEDMGPSGKRKGQQPEGDQRKKDTLPNTGMPF